MKKLKKIKIEKKFIFLWNKYLRATNLSLLTSLYSPLLSSTFLYFTLIKNVF